MTYVPRLPPYPHQREALKRMRGKKAFALLMAMRTGKSKVICDEFAEMVECGSAQDLLLIAPAGVYKTWHTEFLKQWPDDWLQKSLSYTWQSGASKAALRELAYFMDFKDSPRVFLINVEALSTVDKVRDACKTFLSQRRSICVVDESTTLRNPSSKRTKFIVQKLAPLAAYRRILSGLPTPRSPLDLFSQFEFLDIDILGHRSYHTFKRRYGVVVNKCFLPHAELLARWYRRSPDIAPPHDRDELVRELLARRSLRFNEAPEIVVGYQNVEELQALIAPHSYRVTLDQVRSATPPVYKRWEVRLTTEQERIYREIKETATTELSAGVHVTATAVITQILRLHQTLCGHVKDEGGKTHEVPEKRTAAVLDVLADYDGKAIIWTCYDHSVRQIHAAIEKEYGPGSCARFWGGNLSLREEEEQAFKTDARCRFIVATQAAGGRGRTWDMADLHVFHANSYDLEHRDQAEQRAEGVAKNIPATRIDIVAPGTVDERIIAALRAKIDLAAAVTGDGWREWLV